MKKIIIIGSSRKDGNTKKVVDELNSLSGYDIVDLNDYNINYYDYKYRNGNDAYLNLVKTIINNYDTFIFATPVYWYSMSGVMKVFFDRFADLLDKEKVLGKKLRNKNMAVLSSSIGDHLGEIFWLPFIESARYLGMNYVGNIHTIANKHETERLRKFTEAINEKVNQPASHTGLVM